jgi:MFS family permease
VTSDAATADQTEPGPLYCYRHPGRETWVRCGRCDQPICTSCAMQGPVGLRCKKCGKPSRDALASLKPSQIAIGLAVATGLGVAVGYFGAQLGFFMIVLGFFAGTIIAEALDRSIGIKRGPRILTIAIAGIVLGGLIGATLSMAGTWREIQGFAEAARAAGEPDYPLDAFLVDTLPQVLVGIIATVVGAVVRLK